MTTVFKHPPLVELIAEVRFGPPLMGLGSGGGQAIVQGADGQPMQFAFVASYESFFMRFAVEAHRLGFTIQERVLPPNAVVVPYQTVWRWKKPEIENLYLQLGMGVFTVNGAPPTYESWDTFLPTVEEGVKGLIASFESFPGEAPKCFSQTHLRYIDLFNSERVKDMAPLDFLGNVMGLRIQLPEVVDKLVGHGAVKPHLNFQIPTEDGHILLTFGDGVVGGRRGHIFDSTVTRNGEIPLTHEAVVKCFGESHKVTNDLFMSMTKPLHDEMEVVHD
ncbi:TIGR04255 family protein [Pandoraea sp. PE-S2T-3]|uniref:TIGR04255 family protein n=1 Tax=Pandoraea sp. PE-S2T-3 TaxID=1986993 RepID=UPI000B3FAD10|nr:TIGR04255 family protein [Pandoraea sp. PE-S2T-3]